MEGKPPSAYALTNNDMCLGDVLAFCSEEIKGGRRDGLGAGTKLSNAWLG